MLGPKLAFFETLAKEAEPFLKSFQADKPMVPFLYTDLHDMMKNVMGHFVKDDVLNQAACVIDINISDDKNLVQAKHVKVGNETKNALRKASEESATPLDILTFKKDCLLALKTFCAKMKTKSPLSYKLTKALSFCNPEDISNSVSVAKKRLTITIEEFVKKGWVGGIEGDRLEREFATLFSKVAFVETMKTFSRDERLDLFWKKKLSVIFKVRLN